MKPQFDKTFTTVCKYFSFWLFMNEKATNYCENGQQFHNWTEVNSTSFAFLWNHLYIIYCLLSAQGQKRSLSVEPWPIIETARSFDSSCRSHFQLHHRGRKVVIQSIVVPVAKQTIRPQRCATKNDFCRWSWSVWVVLIMDHGSTDQTDTFLTTFDSGHKSLNV